MAGNKLENMKVAAVLTDGFEEVEFVSPKDAMESEGAIVRVVSPSEGRVQGWNQLERGSAFYVDVPVDEAEPADYEAVLLPGGALNTEKLRTNAAALDFVRHINDSGKPVLVIGHGPWILISAGLAHGRRMTSSHSLRDDLQNAGANWVNEAVVIDDNFVSSRGPSDLAQFDKAIVYVLEQYRERGPVEEVRLITVERGENWSRRGDSNP